MDDLIQQKFDITLEEKHIEMSKKKKKKQLRENQYHSIKKKKKNWWYHKPIILFFSFFFLMEWYHLFVFDKGSQVYIIRETMTKDHKYIYILFHFLLEIIDERKIVLQNIGIVDNPIDMSQSICTYSNIARNWLMFTVLDGSVELNKKLHLWCLTKFKSKWGFVVMCGLFSG